jgi:hypothetical protein
MSQGGQPRLKLAWGHVSNLLGVRKSDGVPEHKIPEQTLESKNNEGGQGIPESLSSPQKLWTFYMCPRAAFYREANGLLHSEATLESREYS